MSKFRRPTERTGDSYNKILEQGQNSGEDINFPVQSVKSQYSMWGFVFQEIANIRMEVSRLGVAVRINNSSSPLYLETYHSHIYSFLIPISVIIQETKWKKIEALWLECKKDIEKYLTERKAIPNKKIPFTLIQKLDRLYRIALLAAQLAGLGISVETDTDIGKAIEEAITGG